MFKQKSRVAGLLVVLLLVPFWAQTGADQARAPTQGLLWEIRAGNAAPSYLLGTMHSDDPRLLELPAQLERVLQSASSFTMEVIIDPLAMTELGQHMLLPPQESLADMLDARTWQRLVSAMRQRPWAVAMVLSMPQQFSGLALDLYLQQYAARLGKKLYGLESIEEQVAVFEGLSKAEQVQLLQTTLLQLPELPALIEALTAAYLAGDLAAMQALTDAQLAIGDAQFNRRFIRRLIDERNVKMLRRMQPRLREGGALIAVGAMHLPGERGLLRLLRDQGYELGAIY
ncbi:MAG: TraB/GumN family protein [Gammaproteobacteria bacterium]|nr:TraB/GumN family protein [Gammaproteobacteria bacterium]